MKMFYAAALSLALTSMAHAHYFDAETGLHYNYFRDYDPAVGRYIESDPIGLLDGPNTYTYVRSNPVMHLDATGLATCVYSISLHTLVCISNDLEDVAMAGPNNVFSGSGQCQNNVECLDKKDIGPVLPGEYDLVRVTRGPRAGQYWLDEGWFARRDKKRFGRFGFFLHQGSFSQGCITLRRGLTDSEWRAIDDILRGDGDDNRMFVQP